MITCNFFCWISIILVQTVIIIHLMNQSMLGKLDELNDSSNLQKSITLLEPSTVVLQKDINQNSHNPLIIEGVAATLMLHQPKWFQRRYTMMIYNILNNVPKNWVVQIFYTGEGQSQAGIDLNLGLKRLIENGKVFLTLIPIELQNIKRRRIELLLDPWIWSNMMADKVLIFGGNSVLCGNSPYTLEMFSSRWDYIGAPWSSYGGRGGEGEISLRYRPLMLRIIQEELNKYSQDKEKQKTVYKSWGQEDHFFVSRIVNLISAGEKNIRLASKNATMKFAASSNYVSDDVFAASGTLPGISFEARDSFLNACLDLKMIYPSLHDPNCFGATPNGEKCAENICALHPRKGGC